MGQTRSRAGKRSPRVRRSLVTALLLGSVAAAAQVSRDHISIVGSSTVYPFATVVAERFGRATRFKTPTIESTGTGGGFRLFCGGIGVQYPDIVNASRRIRQSEVGDCAANGVDSVVEVKIGYDGIVLANNKTGTQFSLQLREIYLALAKNVPNPEAPSELVRNPYRLWSDVDPALPAIEIEVMGPPPTSGTRDTFVELVMEPGCSGLPAVMVLTDAEQAVACQTIREDGGYVETGENDNLIVQKLGANPDALGIFGYSFLEQNFDKVKGARIAGVAPDFEAIATGRYPLARPLYFYVKAAHVGSIPGLEEFLAEFVSEAATGEFGYLSDKGLVPMPDAERESMLERVSQLDILDSADVER